MKQHYQSFSPQRRALRRAWNATNGISWQDYLNEAEKRQEMAQVKYYSKLSGETYNVEFFTIQGHGKRKFATFEEALSKAHGAQIVVYNEHGGATRIEDCILIKPIERTN